MIGSSVWSAACKPLAAGMRVGHLQRCARGAPAACRAGTHPPTPPTHLPLPLPLPGHELAKLEEEYTVLVHKNMDIDTACRQLEAEIAALQEAQGGASAAAGAEAEPEGSGGPGTGGEQQGGEQPAAGGGEEQPADGPVPAGGADAMQE